METSWPTFKSFGPMKSTTAEFVVSLSIVGNICVFTAIDSRLVWFGQHYFNDCSSSSSKETTKYGSRTHKLFRILRHLHPFQQQRVVVSTFLIPLHFYDANGVILNEIKQSIGDAIAGPFLLFDTNGVETETVKTQFLALWIKHFTVHIHSGAFIFEWYVRQYNAFATFLYRFCHGQFRAQSHRCRYSGRRCFWPFHWLRSWFEFIYFDSVRFEKFLQQKCNQM